MHRIHASQRRMRSLATIHGTQYAASKLIRTSYLLVLEVYECGSPHTIGSRYLSRYHECVAVPNDARIGCPRTCVGVLMIVSGGTLGLAGNNRRWLVFAGLVVVRRRNEHPFRKGEADPVAGFSHAGLAEVGNVREQVSWVLDAIQNQRWNACC